MTSGLSEATTQLRTLGSVDLRAADGTQIQSVLRQPKRLALLIYLALNGPGFQRRDRLLATFWPESSEERARANLAQQVFQLRQALGRESVVSRGDEEIGLAADRIWCDAVAFDDLLRAGCAAEAMELYTGELLPGFIIDDAPDFDRWLEEERTRRNAAAAAACTQLSEDAETSGDLPAAIRWVRHGISIQPYSEAAYRRLIGLLEQTGDRAAALLTFDELRQLLETEFGVQPSAETTELVEHIHARAEPKRISARTAQPPDPVRPIRETRRTGSRAAAVIGSATIIIAAVIWGVVAAGEQEPYRPPIDHVAVLYFADQSPSQDLAYLAEGLTSTLIDQLGQVKQIKVISQNGVRPFRGESIPLDSVARQLDVGTLVGGSITSSNDRLRVTVQLIDGASGMVRESKRLERPNGELFALLDDVSAEVATFLRSALGSEIRLRAWQAETRSIEAWQLSSRAEVLHAGADSAQQIGDNATAVRNLDQADSMLERATRLDRDWAAPHVLRGRMAVKRAFMSVVIDRPPRTAEWLQAAEDHANRALKADERSHAAYELRGSVRFFRSQFMPDLNTDALLADAERDLASALSMNPDLPQSASRLSAVYYVQGRFEEARNAALRALQADAYLTDADEIVNRLFSTSFETGDDEEAGFWCDEVRRRMPNSWTAAYCDLILLGWSSVGAPDPRKALHLLEQAGSGDSPALRAAMRPRLVVLAAGVLARSGQRDSAQAMIARARADAPHDREVAFLEAAVRVILGEKEQARTLLREVYTNGSSAQPKAETRRMFRPLRDQ